MKQWQELNLAEPQRNRNATATTTKPQRNRKFRQFNNDQYCTDNNM